MQEFERLKIIVAGDSGVGKTAFVHLLCHRQALPNPSWTIGSCVEIMMSEPYMGKRYFLEFWDIGGSVLHKKTRSVFYENVDGVMLVHDLSNKKSELNLRKWLEEIRASNGLLKVVCSSESFQRKCRPSGGQNGDLCRSSGLPLLVVGTKVDQVKVPSQLAGFDQRQSTNSILALESHHPPRIGSFAAENNIQEIIVNCNSLSCIGLDSLNAKILLDFFDQIMRQASREFSVDFGNKQASFLCSNLAHTRSCDAVSRTSN